MFTGDTRIVFAHTRFANRVDNRAIISDKRISRKGRKKRKERKKTKWALL